MNREFEQAVGQVKSVPQELRRLGKRMGLWQKATLLSGLYMLASGGGCYAISNREVEEGYRVHPVSSEDITRYNSFLGKIKDSQTYGHSSGAEGEFKRADLYASGGVRKFKACFKSTRGTYIAALKDSHGNMDVRLALAAALWFGTTTASFVGWDTVRKEKAAKGSLNNLVEEEIDHLKKAFETIDPDELLARILILPPVGSKISFNGQKRIEIIDPAFSAEHETERVMSEVKERGFKDGFIHQLTVQGRLPDEFKYAGLALILASPHPDDWHKTFYNVPWGKTSPLIHDGGKVRKEFNPIWRNVDGRTDFIRRIVWVDQLGLLEEETVRMRRDARFYQRLGLSLHAHIGTAPSAISEDIRTQLSTEWQNFRDKMNIVLNEYEINGVAEVPWFNNEPRKLWDNFPPRYEADWEPIQQQLFHLETVKGEYPEVQERISGLLRASTNRIDDILGLTSLLPPQAA